jgi:hypothetical protein
MVMHFEGVVNAICPAPEADERIITEFIAMFCILIAYA